MDKWKILLLLLVAFLIAGLFALDLMTPLNTAAWLPYFVVIPLTLWLPGRRYTFLAAGLASVLTIAGLALSPPGGSVWRAAINRLIAVGAFWITAFEGLAARKTHELEKANKALKEEIERRERLESQLLRTQRLESIGTLAGGIAHDFNNLLTPILMSVKLLKEDRDEDERQRLLSALQVSAERGAQMVKQLLSFAGGSEGQRVVVEPKVIITEVVAILNHMFPKSIRVEAQLPDLAWPVFANATQLSQVLMNLCVNARDAMPDGGVLTVRLAKTVLRKDDPLLPIEAKPGAYVVIGIADTGTGIASDIIDKIFDPFFTTKGPGRGSGLGLSTALGIVQGHGGFINVTSELGSGSQFDVYLPAARAPLTEQLRERRQDLPAGDGMLILVVDDEALIRETASATLQRRGYQVLTASDGAEAIELYRRRRAEIGAVILDMMLPGIDGPSIMDEFERLDPELPLIVSSGLPVRGRVADRISAGRGALLPKPYSDEQMLAAVAEAVKKQSD